MLDFVMKCIDYLKNNCMSKAGSSIMHRMLSLLEMNDEMRDGVVENVSIFFQVDLIGKEERRNRC